jgi:transcriptional regulator with XRE-family HTH domain
VVKRNTPELDRLMKRVRTFTKRRGAIQKLSDEIGVARPTLSDWLRGRYEPGGEVTLKLQKWVIAAEAKQPKKTAAMLVTSQRQMTRSAKSQSHEKAKSDRPKG